MKNPIITFIAGITTGSLAVCGSLFIASRIINKHMDEEETRQNDRHEKIIDKMKNILNETESENMIETYVNVIDNTRKVFENDYDTILDRFDNILDSGKEYDEIAKNLENYISALDILHDYYIQEQEHVEETVVEDAVDLEQPVGEK